MRKDMGETGCYREMLGATGCDTKKKKKHLLPLPIILVVVVVFFSLLPFIESNPASSG